MRLDCGILFLGYVAIQFRKTARRRPPDRDTKRQNEAKKKAKKDTHIERQDSR